MANNNKKIVTVDFLQKYHDKNFKILTKEEFLNLTDAEKNCGIVYFVSDANTVIDNTPATS